MEKEDFKIVFSGHVDHGKSTLIGRLLYETESLPADKIKEIENASKELGRDIEWSFILDALQEEREQNITIDTTQIFFKTAKRNYAIIDAPGHVEFVKNMITGATQAEAAVLVIDANEGVREQTTRHAYILSLLGLKKVIVLVNKMDLINYDSFKFQEIKKEILLFLSRVGIEPFEIVPMSAKMGDNVKFKSNNMKWYSGESFLGTLDNLEKEVKDSGKALRYPIQDVYKVDDKRIFVGRVEAGKIVSGQEIVILPKQTKTRVKSVEKFLANDEERNQGIAGECIGITTSEPVFSERGDVVCFGDLPKFGEELEANVFWMSKQNMLVGDKIVLKIATQEVEGKVSEIVRRMNSSSLEEIEDKSRLENNEVAKMIIKLSRPIVYDKFVYCPEMGRLVLERGNEIVAGGII